MEGSGNLVWDILSFKVLITPALLVFLYYLGALIIPFADWFFLKRYVRKAREALVSRLAETEIGQAVKESDVGQRFWLYYALIFVFLELGWRVMFEFFVAYFQMHNSLMALGNV